MSFPRTALLAFALATATLVPRAATAATPAAATARPAATRPARASLALSAKSGAAWVGQAIPVTVTAVFRDVEGVTLEGAPTLTSKAVMTADVAKEPRQSNEVIGGERVLVARWAATVTPSSAGPLDLRVELPVQLKYREATAHAARPDDPFAGFGDGDDAFDAIFDRMRRQMQATVEDFGAVHEERMALMTSIAPLDVRALPSAGQPATFTGAVGSFDIDATLSSATPAVSEPITLRITVGGDVDPDRVDLPGVASSSAWKAYPPRAMTPAAPAPGAVRAKTAKKVFEQVLVPLEGGELTVPAISFTSFDPGSGRYLTRSTRPLEVTVSGAAAPAPIAPAPSPPHAIPTITAEKARGAITAGLLTTLALVLAAAAARLVRLRRPTWELRRSMRRAAAAGGVEPFLGAAHALVAARLAARWGVAPSDVTASSVRERLGPEGEPLAEVLVADAALRFGRGGLEGGDLEALSRAVERSLRAAVLR